MEKCIQHIICPFCEKKILVPPKWWGKNMDIRCRGCGEKWREVIPIPASEEPTVTEELSEGARSLLSEITKEMRDFLFPSDSKK